MEVEGKCEGSQGPSGSLRPRRCAQTRLNSSTIPGRNSSWGSETSKHRKINQRRRLRKKKNRNNNCVSFFMTANGKCITVHALHISTHIRHAIIFCYSSQSTSAAVLCVHSSALYSREHAPQPVQHKLFVIDSCHTKPPSATGYEGKQNNKYVVTVHHCALQGPGPAPSPPTSSRLKWSGPGFSYAALLSRESRKQAEVRVGVRRSAPAFPTPEACT